MTPIPLLIALSSVGIDAGWQPLKNGGLEYTVQVEPQQLRMLKPGDELVSEVPPKSRDIRRIRVTVGTEKLARTELPAAADGKQDVLAAKSVVVPATAEEPVEKEPLAGPRFPGDPPVAVDKTTLADGKAEPPRPEPPQPEAALADNPAAEKRVAGYPKSEVALTTLPGGEDDKFGWPFLATATGLCASLGANLFLGWVAWGVYGKYRSLARRLNPGSSPA